MESVWPLDDLKWDVQDYDWRDHASVGDLDAARFADAWISVGSPIHLNFGTLWKNTPDSTQLILTIGSDREVVTFGSLMDAIQSYLWSTRISWHTVDKYLDYFAPSLIEHLVTAEPSGVPLAYIGDNVSTIRQIKYNLETGMYDVMFV
jgi:hypothetical protein